MIKRFDLICQKILFIAKSERIDSLNIRSVTFAREMETYKKNLHVKFHRLKIYSTKVKNVKKYGKKKFLLIREPLEFEKQP